MEEKVYTIIPRNIDEGYNDEDLVHVSYCYLHGKLERLAGFDIFCMLKSELLSEQVAENITLSDEFGEGIYPCICMGKPCTFFRWRTKGHHKTFAGLVVLDYDLQAYEYAFKCYYNNETNI